RRDVDGARGRVAGRDAGEPARVLPASETGEQLDERDLALADDAVGHAERGEVVGRHRREGGPAEDDRRRTRAATGVDDPAVVSEVRDGVRPGAVVDVPERDADRL